MYERRNIERKTINKLEVREGERKRETGKLGPFGALRRQSFVM